MAENKWRKWDGLGRRREWVDAERDHIYYYREYTAGVGYSYGESNNLILNFKIGPNPTNHGRLYYRNLAIDTFVRELCLLLKSGVDNTWISWIPSSKSPEDPEYDNRLELTVERVCRQFTKLQKADVLYTRESRPPLHAGGWRDPDQIIPTLEWYDRVDLSGSSNIILIDDLLTHGTTFNAVCSVIRDRYPQIVIAGVFWALTVDSDFEGDDEIIEDS